LLNFREFPDSSIHEYLSCFLEVPSQLHARASEVGGTFNKSIVRNLEKVFQQDQIPLSTQINKRKFELYESYYDCNENDSVTTSNRQVDKVNNSIMPPQVNINENPSGNALMTSMKKTRPAFVPLSLGLGGLKIRNLYVEKADVSYVDIPLEHFPGDSNAIQCNQSFFVTSIQVLTVCICLLPSISISPSVHARHFRHCYCWSPL
jgi:hypothetical protein